MMNKIMIVILTHLLSLLSCIAAAEIRNVTAKQRFPWNGKVDITYEVVGDVSEGLPTWNMPRLLVTATNRVAGTSYVAAANALSGDTGSAEGVHHVIWDLSAQGIDFKSDKVVFTVAYVDKLKPSYKYCVIDLSGGSSAQSYPVSYLVEPPSGGFAVDVYKTTKLVLKRIEPGSFKMGGSYGVTLTQPFYCGIFEVTQKQYSLVKGDNPSAFNNPIFFSGEKLPVERVSYDMIRGSANGAKWPSSSAVDAASFIAILRARTGVDFDLPTEAQWEYACRAGTTTSYSYGDSANGKYMWYDFNSKTQTHEVGMKSPNPWGLYDMHGNVSEWCLDWSGRLSSGVRDPKGSSSGSNRVLRGGDSSDAASECTSAYRYYSPPNKYAKSDFDYFGFRLVRTLSE